MTVDPGGRKAPAAAPPSRAVETPSVRAERQRRSQKLLLLAVRLLFLVLLVTVSLLTIASRAQRVEEFDLTTFAGLFIGTTALGILVLVLDVLTPNKRLTAMVGVYLGICVGLIGALAIGALVDVVAEAWDLTRPPINLYVGLAKVVIAIVLCYLAVSVVLTTKDDFRLVIPYVEFAREVRGIRPMLVDTSALIDGRIESLGRSGFLDAPLVLPQFVIDELQTLGDSSDKQKRARGRRGLAMVGDLQADPYVDLAIDESTDVPGQSVDHKLLHMAKQQGHRVLTTDSNLERIGQIQGVTVLNLNDLANVLKSQAIPGETLAVDIVKAGEGEGQGVGYLDDGTMVVIEGAVAHVGERVVATVTNSLQTSAGRMIFGRVDEPAGAENLARAATSQPRATGRPPKRTGPSGSRNPRR